MQLMPEQHLLASTEQTYFWYWSIFIINYFIYDFIQHWSREESLSIALAYLFGKYSHSYAIDLHTFTKQEVRR